MLVRSAPIITLSLACSKSSMLMVLTLERAASRAASFTMLASSAPEKPGVPLARVRKSTSVASGTFLACTCRIITRPLTSGRGTFTCRSKRPGRFRAGSRISGRLVAATMMMPELASKPSISTSNWFRVCSRSSLVPAPPLLRCRPTASISSMKMMQGAFFWACLNRSRTREAPTPTYISTKSEPLKEKNGTPASPAMARASKVLPVPGSPESNTPLGILAPTAANMAGFFKKSTISLSSSIASSMPATSLKVTLDSSPSMSRARLLPMLIMPLPPPCDCFMKKIQAPINSSMGTQEIRLATYQGGSWSCSTRTLTPAARKGCTRVASLGITVLKRTPPTSWAVTSYSLMVSWAILPVVTFSMKSL